MDNSQKKEDEKTKLVDDQKKVDEAVKSGFKKADDVVGADTEKTKELEPPTQTKAN